MPSRLTVVLGNDPIIREELQGKTVIVGDCAYRAVGTAFIVQRRKNLIMALGCLPSFIDYELDKALRKQ